jgi:cytochrome c-type biogenesis protein CcmH/NrfG
MAGCRLAWRGLAPRLASLIAPAHRATLTEATIAGGVRAVRYSLPTLRVEAIAPAAPERVSGPGCRRAVIVVLGVAVVVGYFAAVRIVQQPLKALAAQPDLAPPYSRYHCA